MNIECFEENLLGFADLIRDIWFEGMRIIFCYPSDNLKEDIEDIGDIESGEWVTFDDEYS